MTHSENQRRLDEITRLAEQQRRRVEFQRLNNPITCLADLKRRPAEIQQRLHILESEITKAEKDLNNYIEHLHTTTPQFVRFLKNMVYRDPRESNNTYSEKLSTLRQERSLLIDQLKDNPLHIEVAKKRKKRFIEAQLSRAAADHRQKQQHQEQAEFAERSVGSLANPFDRSHFHIQAKDYRRGNAIDNYCRNILEDAILATFDHCCTFCGSDHDLTFDHYGLTKNEGGNFILLANDKQSLRINLVVLCRSCNSMKSQRLHHHFFTEEQQRIILAYQQCFLSTVLNDVRFMKLIKKWGQ